MSGIEHIFLDLDGMPPSRGKRIARGVIALMLWALVAWISYVETTRTVGHSTWSPTSCTIVESRVERAHLANLRAGQASSDRPYKLVVRYRYDVPAPTGTTHQISTHESSTDDAAEAYEGASKWTANSQSTCYVNPQRLIESVLARDAVWGYWIFVGVVGMSGIILIPFYILPNLLLAAPRKSWRPVSMRSERIAAMIFIAIALGCIVLCAVNAILPTLRTRTWQPTPCTIVSRNVMAESSQHGHTYRSDVLYHYRVGEKVFHSNQYSFTDYATLWWYAGKRRIAMQYNDGQTTTCFVNPRDPSQAVLSRAFAPPTMWFALTIPILTLGIVAYWQNKGNGGKQKLDPAITRKLVCGIALMLLVPVVSVIDVDFIADVRDRICTSGEILGVVIGNALVIGALLYGWAFSRE